MIFDEESLFLCCIGFFCQKIGSMPHFAPFLAPRLYAFGVAVFLWRRAALALEELGEVLNVEDPAVQSDGLYLQIGGAQKMLGVLYPSLPDVLGNRL